MHSVEEVDVQKIMEQIKEKLGRSRPESPRTDPPRSHTDEQLTADLSALHSGYDIYQINFTSHRQIMGRFVVAAKRILRQLMTPVLTRQVAYNASNTRVVTILKERLVSLDHEERQLLAEVEALRQQQGELRDQLREEVLAHDLQGLRAEVEALRQQQGELREEVLAHDLQGLRAEVEALRQQQGELRDQIGPQVQMLQTVRDRVEALTRQHTQELQRMRERAATADGKVRRIFYALSNGQEQEKRNIERKNLPLSAFEANFDALGFGERFWGSEAELKKRRRIYVDMFRQSDEVVDLGCGRGEFLELLRESGIKAKGVDTDLDMILLCREKGLEVIREDAFAYLESQPDATLGGIFAAQIVEHLEPGQVVELVRLCHRKLRPEGVLIMETPNPMCLMVFAQCFYMDFTHTRPIHPQALKFLAESVGFHEVALKFLSPVDPSLRLPLLNDPRLFGPQGEQFNRSIAYLNELLYGYQDYAVIVKR